MCLSDCYRKSINFISTVIVFSIFNRQNCRFCIKFLIKGCRLEKWPDIWNVSSLILHNQSGGNAFAAISKKKLLMPFFWPFRKRGRDREFTLFLVFQYWFILLVVQISILEVINDIFRYELILYNQQKLSGRLM